MFTAAKNKNKSSDQALPQETLDAGFWHKRYQIIRQALHCESAKIIQPRQFLPFILMSWPQCWPDCNTAKQNACCFCKSTNVKYRRIGDEELMLATLQQRFLSPDTESRLSVRLRQSPTPAPGGHIQSAAPAPSLCDHLTIILCKHSNLKWKVSQIRRKQVKNDNTGNIKTFINKFLPRLYFWRREVFSIHLRFRREGDIWQTLQLLAVMPVNYAVCMS